MPHKRPDETQDERLDRELTGLGAMAIAMNGAILLVTDLLFDGIAVVIATIAAATLFAGLWFVLGIVRRVGHERSRA